MSRVSPPLVLSLWCLVAALLLSAACVTAQLGSDSLVIQVGVTAKVSGDPFFNVGYPDEYTLDGLHAPTLNLTLGVSYVFVIDVPSIHPFYIGTSSVGDGAGFLAGGVTNGNLSFTPSSATPASLFYQCQNHPNLGNAITVLPATPPASSSSSSASPPPVSSSGSSTGASAVASSAPTSTSSSPSPVPSASSTSASSSSPSLPSTVPSTGSAAGSSSSGTIPTASFSSSSIASSAQPSSSPSAGAAASSSASLLSSSLAAVDSSASLGSSSSGSTATGGAVASSSAGLSPSSSTPASSSTSASALLPPSSSPSSAASPTTASGGSGSSATGTATLASASSSSAQQQASSFSSSPAAVSSSVGVGSSGSSSGGGGGAGLAPAVVYSVSVVAKVSGDPFFNVGYPDEYTLNGLHAPQLVMTAGVNYTFVIDVPSIHPFYIGTSSVGEDAGFLAGGVTSGNLSFVPSASGPSTLYYQCENHPNMGNAISVLQATPPASSSSSALPAGAAGSPSSSSAQAVQGIGSHSGAAVSASVSGLVTLAVIAACSATAGLLFSL